MSRGARGSAPLRYADWLSGVERRGPEGAHLFCGPESLLRDQALEEVRTRMGGGEEIRPDRFYAGECSLAQVANAAVTVGLFQPRRLVLLHDVERAGRAGKKDQAALFEAVENLPEGSCFVATSGLPAREFTAKNELARGLAARCTFVEFAHPRPAEALRWILGQSARLRTRLTPDAGELLLAKIGPALEELARELEKLQLWAEEGETVDADRLRDLVRQGHLGNAWEFCDAVVEGRTEDALRAWEAVQTIEPVPRLLWVLQQRARERLARERGAAEQARLERLVIGLCDLEHGIKSGRIPSGQDGRALERTIAETGRSTDGARAIR